MKTIKTISLTLFIAIGMFAWQAADGQDNDNDLELPDLTSDQAVAAPAYGTAIGVRAGHTGAITLKHKFGGHHALEGIVGLWHRGLSATLLWEKYVPAFNVAGLNWYYGAGGHMSFADYYYVREPYPYPYEYRRRVYYRGEVGFGVDGIIGMEYQIPSIPFAVSLDLIPYIEVVTNGDIWGTIDPGVGIKFVF